MTLIQLAHNDLRYSTIALMMKKDDAAIRHAAFLAQQSIEKTLNYILVQNGLPYEKTHNLTTLISKVYATGWEVPTYIVGRAQLTTKWQYQARYNNEFDIEYSDLEFTLTLAQIMVNGAAEKFGYELQD